MEKAVKIDMKQRESLIDLLNKARRIKREEVEQSNWVSKDSIVRELIEQEGGSKLLKEIGQTKRQIAELEYLLKKQDQELEDMGFEREGLSFSLRWNVSESLQKQQWERLSKVTKEIETPLKVYDAAIARVLIASTPEELLRSVEGLL